MAGDDQLRQRLRSLFSEELQDGLLVLSNGLLAWENGAGASDTERVHELFRAAHSLKGAAHAAGFPEAVATCDRLETAFAAVRDGGLAVDADLITRLLGETDALTALSDELRATSSPAEPRGAATPAPTPAPAAAVVATARAGAASPPGAALRITVDKVDALFQHSADGLAASRRLSVVAGQAVEAAERVDAARARLRSTELRSSVAGAEDLERLLDEAATAAALVARSVEAAERTSRRASNAVAAAAQGLRTQPFSEACAGLDRVVRDVATATGKQAELHVLGGDVEVDRAVVAALRDPLLHLVRNAVDHGIEQPDVRVRAGKPATGTVDVVAALDGSLLTVVVRDDGGGIDTQRLREVAERRGLPVPDDGELPFVPGLSSREDVTTVSGRGVGLDAARDRLEQLGGAVQVQPRPGGGTVITLTSPVTLGLLRVLLAQAGGHVVAVPTSSVRRVEYVARPALREAEGAVLLSLPETSVRVVSLATAMGLQAKPLDSDTQLAVLVPRGGDTVLVADTVLDEVEVAVQPVPARLAGATGVLGLALVDGQLPALVVNPVALGRSRGAFPVPPAAPARAAAPAARILVAEDTVTTRALERSILEGAGYSVAVAVDGADAWQQLQDNGADLVLSDVDMPRMTGLELCRRIRSSSQFRELPVVLVTSLDSEDDRAGGLAAGADAYVVKAEFQQGTLLDTIARLL